MLEPFKNRYNIRDIKNNLFSNLFGDYNIRTIYSIKFRFESRLKMSLKCSIICAFRNGVSCKNVPEVSLDFDDEDEEIPEINQFFTIETRDDKDETKEEDYLHGCAKKSKKQKIFNN